MTTSFPVIVVKKYVKKAYLALTFERAVTVKLVQWLLLLFLITSIFTHLQ